MPNGRQIIGSGGQFTWKTVLTVAAVLTILGALPALVIGIGPAAVSTATVAGLYLLARKYGVMGNE